MTEFWAALIGALIGSIVPAITLRFNYRQLFAQSVSSNRMDWINVWRENISKFLACAEVLHNRYRCKNIPLLQVEKEMYEARGMVVSRLNLKEEEHRKMLLLMNNFSVHCSNHQFIKQREEILELARNILKYEWERVKAEANGRKCQG